jgi:hypothetical protein
MGKVLLSHLLGDAAREEEVGLHKSMGAQRGAQAGAIGGATVSLGGRRRDSHAEGDKVLDDRRAGYTRRASHQHAQLPVRWQGRARRSLDELVQRGGIGKEDVLLAVLAPRRGTRSRGGGGGGRVVADERSGLGSWRWRRHQLVVASGGIRGGPERLAFGTDGVALR